MLCYAMQAKLLIAGFAYLGGYDGGVPFATIGDECAHIRKVALLGRCAH